MPSISFVLKKGLLNVHYDHDIFVFREVNAVLKFLKEQCGVKHVGAVGFCWGGVATHYLALQYPEVKAGVSVYGLSFTHSVTLFFFQNMLRSNDSLVPVVVKRNHSGRRGQVRAEESNTVHLRGKR